MPQPRIKLPRAPTPAKMFIAPDGSYGEFLLSLVEQRFGEPLPEMKILHGGRMPTPADMGRHTIQILEYFIRVYEEEEDGPTRKLAEATIRQYWGYGGSPPHIRFAWMVMGMAPMTLQADLPQMSVARTVIEVFGVTHPDLARNLDAGLVQAALEAATRGDGRKYRGEASWWKALADAWSTTGDKKKPSTFKTDWFKEKRRNAALNQWLLHR